MRSSLSFASVFAVCAAITSTTASVHSDAHPFHHKRFLEYRRSPFSEIANLQTGDSTLAAQGPTLTLLQSIEGLIEGKASGNAGSQQGTVAAAGSAPPSSSCFPALGFQMPNSVPDSLDNWWCDPSTEYAFVGFSYEVTGCQSAEQLQKEFKDIRETFNGRYIRLYGTCDRKGFYDDVVDAAWDNTLGVHSLIWFGFDGTDEWKTRRDTLIETLHSNPKAPFITRVLQFGSEPLFDSVLTPSQLADEVLSAKLKLADVRIPVTVSEMAYGFQKYLKSDRVGVMRVLTEIDSVNAHILPFFSAKASTADKSWPIVKTDLDWFAKNAPGKKIYMDENGWPSVSYAGVRPNSPNAVADVQNEQAYFTLLDNQCDYMKSNSIAWFFHLYSDSQEPGYGLYTTAGKIKFPFKPQTEC